MSKAEEKPRQIDGTVTFEPVFVKNLYGVENPSQMKVISRTFQQRAKRSAKRSGKMYLAVACILPVAIFVHILLAISALTLVTATGLFFWGLGDSVTFEYVEGKCPTCKEARKLKPLGTGRLSWPAQITCESCGGTFTAVKQDTSSVTAHA